MDQLSDLFEPWAAPGGPVLRAAIRPTAQPTGARTVLNPQTSLRPTRTLVVAAVSLLVVALTATACATAQPASHQTVPANWGSTLQPHHSDVLYQPGGSTGCGVNQDHTDCGGSQTLDVFLASNSVAARGTIVFIHGGGFNRGDKSLREEMGPVLRQVHRGWDVVAANYRLTDEQRGLNVFPTAVRDVSAAIRWVRLTGPQVGLNTDRIITAGHSAGGTLAALVGTAWNSGRSEFSGTPKVDGYVAFAGIHDFTIGGGSRMWGHIWMSNYAAQARIASPVTWLDPNDPDGYLVHGDRDRMVELDGSVAMAQKAQAFGQPWKAQIDVVDTFANGRPAPAAVRGHAPSAGANVVALDAYFDGR